MGISRFWSKCSGRSSVANFQKVFKQYSRIYNSKTQISKHREFSRVAIESILIKILRFQWSKLLVRQQFCHFRQPCSKCTIHTCNIKDIIPRLCALPVYHLRRYRQSNRGSKFQSAFCGSNFKAVFLKNFSAKQYTTCVDMIVDWEVSLRVYSMDYFSKGGVSSFREMGCERVACATIPVSAFVEANGTLAML